MSKFPLLFLLAFIACLCGFVGGIFAEHRYHHLPPLTFIAHTSAPSSPILHITNEQHRGAIPNDSSKVVLTEDVFDITDAYGAIIMCGITEVWSKGEMLVKTVSCRPL